MHLLACQRTVGKHQACLNVLRFEKRILLQNELRAIPIDPDGAAHVVARRASWHDTLSSGEIRETAPPDPRGGWSGSAAIPQPPPCPLDPVSAAFGRFGTKPLTRRTSAACRMRDPADAALMPLSCAACCKIAYDAGGRSIVTLVALAIYHPLPRYQFVTRSRPCPSSDDTRFLAHSSACNCSAVIASRFGPPRTGQANPASTS